MNKERKPNRLIEETSPYLQQHAYNPVDWYAWGPEALGRAKAENKPILLSIGYSSCHWCHVMEHESFEDESTAALMNENFINIKLDKEERPDLDQIYMNFVQMTTGSGGWPLNVFLTPDLVPFFGGTYFPPAERYRMPSWKRILTSVSDAYNNDIDGITHSAHEILSEMKRAGSLEFSNDGLSSDQLDLAFNAIARTFDQTNGGFGGQPKFPPSMVLEFILSYYKKTKNPLAIEIVTKTLDKMANGGIYDQLGGGFHRYTVDAIWLTPHFEKMLYDNSQLVLIYLHAYQQTKNGFYKKIAIETLEYITREMTHEKGDFYSAQDADSEGVEGKFFVWGQKEILDALGEEDGRIFCFHYDVSEHGNFEESNILNVRQSAEESAEKLNIDPDRLQDSLDRGRKILFDIREKRIKPFRDEKTITAWNGLMLKAFAEAAAIFESAEYLEIAQKNADFLLSEMFADGNLLRTWKDGKAKIAGFLEDHSNLADGLLALYQVTGEGRYLYEAKRLADIMITEFWDEDAGGFFVAGESHDNLILRPKDFFDNAEPSGNSVAVEVLLKLSIIFGDARYEKFAISILRLVIDQIRRYPNGFGRALNGLSFYLNAKKEIVVIGEKGNRLASEIWKDFIPNKVVVLAEAGKIDESLPLLKERGMIDGKATAYVCENYACQFPVTSAEEIRKQLA